VLIDADFLNGRKAGTRRKRGQTEPQSDAELSAKKKPGKTRVRKPAEQAPGDVQEVPKVVAGEVVETDELVVKISPSMQKKCGIRTVDSATLIAPKAEKKARKPRAPRTAKKTKAAKKPRTRAQAKAVWDKAKTKAEAAAKSRTRAQVKAVWDKAKAEAEEERKARGSAIVEVPATSSNVVVLPLNNVTAVLDTITGDSVAFIEFMIKQVGVEVDRLDKILKKDDNSLDPSLVASRRVTAIRTMTILHEKLVTEKFGDGLHAVTIEKAIRRVLGSLEEASAGIIVLDQMNLLIGKLAQHLLGDSAFMAEDTPLLKRGETDESNPTACN